MAIDRVRSGAASPLDRGLLPVQEELLAFHDAGHPVLSWVLGGLVARGHPGGCDEPGQGVAGLAREEPRLRKRDAWFGMPPGGLLSLRAERG